MRGGSAAAGPKQLVCCDPELRITGAPIKLFTVFYILVGIGILVELARQLGFAYVEVRRAEKAAKAAKADHPAETNA